MNLHRVPAPLLVARGVGTVGGQARSQRRAVLALVGELLEVVRVPDQGNVGEVADAWTPEVLVRVEPGFIFGRRRVDENARQGPQTMLEVQVRGPGRIRAEVDLYAHVPVSRARTEDRRVEPAGDGTAPGPGVDARDHVGEALRLGYSPDAVAGAHTGNRDRRILIAAAASPADVLFDDRRVAPRRTAVVAPEIPDVLPLEVLAEEHVGVSVANLFRVGPRPW